MRSAPYVLLDATCCSRGISEGHDVRVHLFLDEISNNELNTRAARDTSRLVLHLASLTSVRVMPFP